MAYIAKACKWDWKNRAGRIACALMLQRERNIVFWFKKIFFLANLEFFSVQAIVFHLRSWILFRQRPSSEKGELLAIVD